MNRGSGRVRFYHLTEVTCESGKKVVLADKFPDGIVWLVGLSVTPVLTEQDIPVKVLNRMAGIQQGRFLSVMQDSSSPLSSPLISLSIMSLDSSFTHKMLFPIKINTRRPLLVQAEYPDSGVIKVAALVHVEAK